MNTRIKPSILLHHPFPGFGTEALSTLHEGGLVLLPTANLWQLVAHAGIPGAVNKLLSACPATKHNRPELIFPDATLLRRWCPAIDPTLETLLHYHTRPLTVTVKAGPLVPLSMIDKNGEVAVRIAFDSGCYRLCEDLEFPLAACQAMAGCSSDLPSRFGKIRSDVLRAADHVEKRRLHEDLGDSTAVTVRMNAQSEIEFIRR